MSEPRKPAPPATLEDLQRMAMGYQQSRALLAAVELGLFTAVAGHPGGAPSTAVAEAAGCDTRATDRLLHALAAIGLLRKVDGLFHLTEASERWLVEGAPDYLSGLRHTANTYKNWSTLDEAVQSGGAVIDTDWDTDAKRRDFIEAMHRRAQGAARELAQRLDLSDVWRVLDVGGGSGVWSMAMCRAREGLTATVLDLPNVTPLTREYIAAEGLEGRMDTQDGSYHEADFGHGYDLVFFSAIVHINSPAENRELMRKSFAALNPGGRIVVQDFIMDEDRTSPVHGALFALNMLVNTARGDTYTEGEIRAWLLDAGCETTERAETGGKTPMLIGRKA